MTCPHEITIGVLADPDLPTRLAHTLGEDLPGRLPGAEGEQVEWRVRINNDPFEAMYPDSHQLIDKARDYVRETTWDLALCITDLPLRDGAAVLVAEVDPDHQVALISLPALGGSRLRHRLRELAVRVVALLRSRRPGSTASPPAPLRGLRMVEREHEIWLIRSGRFGSLLLLAGMVRANRPWQLVVGLSSALAGAMAGTAFGVLYSTIWLLATALGPWRLAGITVSALAALSMWIIVGHGLWERRTRARADRYVALRNAGTVSTVVVGTIVFFLALYVITLAAVALVIPPDYLSSTLGRPCGVPDYLTIALMATVLGTVAGAVGSGLEDDVTVREATYGYREEERQRVVDAQRRAGDD
ncbi:hypothetical protein [Nocardia neocaledoniensis]|uniref:hypothetical protein n=1 Tax=Nocardia neocaledoniensis TaxID=236511 RepID=UPI0024580349|nr:hypothetical protein [Nocardia neocaledoniensis]